MQEYNSVTAMNCKKKKKKKKKSNTLKKELNSPTPEQRNHDPVKRGESFLLSCGAFTLTVFFEVPMGKMTP